VRTHLLALLSFLLALLVAGSVLAQPEGPPLNLPNILRELGFTPLNKGGDTMTGPLVAPIVATAPLATGISATDNANVQNALDSVQTSGGTVIIPGGGYKPSTTFIVHSGTHVACSPGTVFITDPANFTGVAGSTVVALFQNAGWNAGTITDHDIWYTGCTASAPQVYGPNFNIVMFYSRFVERVRVEGVTCIFPGTCTAMVHSDDTVVENSTGVECFAQCFDHYQHPSNAHVHHFTAISQGYGMLANSGDDGQPGITEGVDFSDGYIRLTGGIGPAALTGSISAAIFIAGSVPTPIGISKVRIHDIAIDLGYSSFTGSISGTVLTVAGTVTGTPLGIGSVIVGVGVTPPSGVTPTIITALGSGSGGAGTYTVSQSQTVVSEAMTAGTQSNAIAIGGDGADYDIHDVTVSGGLRVPINIGPQGGGDSPSRISIHDLQFDETHLVTAAAAISLGADNSEVRNVRAINMTGHTYAIALSGAHSRAINNSIPIGSTGEYQLTGSDFTIVDPAAYTWAPTLLTGASATGLPLTTAAGQIKWMGKTAEVCGNLALGTKGSPVVGAMTIGGMATSAGITSSNAAALAHGQLMQTVFTANIIGAPTLPIVIKTIPNSGGFAVASTIDNGTAVALTDANVSNGFSLAFCGPVDFQ
jgi:hypothetical protein